MITMDDKYRFEDFGFIVEPGNVDPITPVFERQTMDIPGRSGLWDFGAEVRGKQLNYPLKIINRFHDDMQRAYNELVAFLFDEFGRPRPIKLVRDYEPNKHYTVKVVSQLVPDRPAEDGSLGLVFVADDPHKYSNVYGDEVLWGSEVVTFEYDYPLGREGIGGSVSITNPQTLSIPVEGLAVQPIFEIDGTASNLEFSTKGYSFKLPNFYNTKWTIDFDKYLVYKNGQETMEEIREFYLFPGNNQVEITGRITNFNVSIKFREKYN